jgi:hypothetical protein
MLFGPVLDCLFWIVLRGSEGKRSVTYFNFQLLIALPMVAQWYLSLGTSDSNVVLGRGAQRFYVFIIFLCFAKLGYDACTNRLRWDVFWQYVELSLQVVGTKTIIPFAISIARLTKTEADCYWGKIRIKLQKKWNEIRHQRNQVLRP